MARKEIRSHCPINFYLEVLGDKWSFLILRDIVFRGKRNYGEFLKSEEGFATNILATRLTLLENEGILKKSVDADDARRGSFGLTEKGLDLLPVMFEIMVWSAKHDSKSEAKRVPKLIAMIKKDPGPLSETVKARLRKGQPLFPDYLK